MDPILPSLPRNAQLSTSSQFPDHHHTDLPLSSSESNASPTIQLPGYHNDKRIMNGATRENTQSTQPFSQFSKHPCNRDVIKPPPPFPSTSSAPLATQLPDYHNDKHELLEHTQHNQFFEHPSYYDNNEPPLPSTSSAAVQSPGHRSDKPLLLPLEE